MPALYELTEEYEALFDAATKHSEEGEIDEYWATAIARLEGTIDDKLEGCARVVKSLEGHSEMLKKEFERLHEKHRVAAARAKELVDYIKANMEALEMKKRRVGPFDLTICNNSQPSVQIECIEDVPAEFDKWQDRAIDKKKVLDAFDQGIDVPGVKLNRGTHLRIR